MPGLICADCPWACCSSLAKALSVSGSGWRAQDTRKFTPSLDLNEMLGLVSSAAKAKSRLVYYLVHCPPKSARGKNACK